MPLHVEKPHSGGGGSRQRRTDSPVLSSRSASLCCHPTIDDFRVTTLAAKAAASVPPKSSHRQKYVVGHDALIEIPHLNITHQRTPTQLTSDPSINSSIHGQTTLASTEINIHNPLFVAAMGGRSRIDAIIGNAAVGAVIDVMSRQSSSTVTFEYARLAASDSSSPFSATSVSNSNAGAGPLTANALMRHNRTAVTGGPLIADLVDFEADADTEDGLFFANKTAEMFAEMRNVSQLCEADDADENENPIDFLAPNVRDLIRISEDRERARLDRLQAKQQQQEEDKSDIRSANLAANGDVDSESAVVAAPIPSTPPTPPTPESPRVIHNPYSLRAVYVRVMPGTTTPEPRQISNYFDEAGRFHSPNIPEASDVCYDDEMYYTNYIDNRMTTGDEHGGHDHPSAAAACDHRQHRPSLARHPTLPSTLADSSPACSMQALAPTTESKTCSTAASPRVTPSSRKSAPGPFDLPQQLPQQPIKCFVPPPPPRADTYDVMVSSGMAPDEANILLTRMIYRWSAMCSGTMLRAREGLAGAPADLPPLSALARTGSAPLPPAPEDHEDLSHWFLSAEPWWERCFGRPLKETSHQAPRSFPPPPPLATRPSRRPCAAPVATEPATPSFKVKRPPAAASRPRR